MLAPPRPAQDVELPTAAQMRATIALARDVCARLSEMLDAIAAVPPDAWPVRRGGPSGPRGGQAIRTAREAMGWSQDDLAARMGISRSAIAQWETSRAAPATNRVAELAELLGLEPADVLPPPTRQE